MVLQEHLGGTEEAIALLRRAITLLERHNLPRDASETSVDIYRNDLQRLLGSEPSGAAPGGDASVVMAAIQAFVGADDWAATRRVVEERRDILLQPNVEAIFQANIDQARQAGNNDAVEYLETHLRLLQACREWGIAAAFAPLENRQAVDLPCDPELVRRTITALRGTPQERMACVAYLREQLAQAEEAGLKALIQTMQTAMFGVELEDLGQELDGAYQATWLGIVHAARAEAPSGIDLLVHNTLAVLGLAADRREEWRGMLEAMREQAAANEYAGMVGLIEAIVALVDSDGDPTGLGNDLEAEYAKAWKRIVDDITR